MEVDAVRRRDHPVAVAIASRRSRSDAVGRAFGDAPANRGPPRRHGRPELAVGVASSVHARRTFSRRTGVILRSYANGVPNGSPGASAVRHTNGDGALVPALAPGLSAHPTLDAIGPTPRTHAHRRQAVRRSDERPPQASTHAPRIVTRECVLALGRSAEDGEPASPGDDHGDRARCWAGTRRGAGKDHRATASERVLDAVDLGGP